MCSLFLISVLQDFVYQMEETSVRGVRENSRTEFISTLKLLTINSQFICADDSSSSSTIPQMYYAFQMSDFHVYNRKEEVLLLKVVSFDTRVSNIFFSNRKYLN